MSYVAYARRFRPQRFEEVVGQESAIATLRRALEQDRTSHAYLFAGPRGVGKTTTARILAKALSCEAGPTPSPCGECRRCRELAEGGSLDVIEIDAASHNSVDNVRELRENAHNATHGSRFRLYILDEVHMLSAAAFNALLKILEEPPSHVKFILCTTDPQRVPETVRSRCTRLDFRRITVRDTIERLRQIADTEGLAISDDALGEIARHVEGGLRDAEVLLEQLSVYAEGEIATEHVRALTGSIDEGKLAAVCAALAGGDAAAALVRTDEILESGADPAELADQLLRHIRGALALQACGESSPVVAGRGIDVDAARRTAEALTQEQLLYAAAALQAARREARLSEQPRIVLELALVRLSRVKELVSLEDLAAQIRSGGLPPASSAPVREPAPPRALRSRIPKYEPSRRPASSSAGPEGERSPFLNGEGGGPTAGEGASVSSRPGPPPAGAPVTGELTLEAVRGSWDLVLSRVTEQAHPVGAFLKPAEPTALDGDRIVLTFPFKYTFHMNRLADDRSHTALVESMASEILGTPVRVAYESSREVVGAAAPSPRETRRSAEAEVLRDPGVQRVMDRFGGRVVGIEEAPADGAPPGEADEGTGAGGG